MPRENVRPTLPGSVPVEVETEAEDRAKAVARNALMRDRTILVGINLCNPCHVPNGRPWKGREDVQKHPDLAAFAAPEWGYRAAVIHYRDVGVPVDVLSEAGLPPGTAISRANADNILRAATRLYQGRECYTTETVARGIRLSAL